MHTFTIKRRAHERRRVAMVSLYPSFGQQEETHYHLDLGSYTPTGYCGREEWTGESLKGDIPIDQLVRWAVRRGFLTWRDES